MNVKIINFNRLKQQRLLAKSLGKGIPEKLDYVTTKVQVCKKLGNTRTEVRQIIQMVDQSFP